MVAVPVIVVTIVLAAVVMRDEAVPTPASGQATAPPPSSVPVPDVGDVYDPVAAGEPLPDGYRPLLDRDQIRPVYEPTFTNPDGVEWPIDSLVIGVAGSEVAKAYPVTHLNQREMVIDELEGEPILVSW